MTLGKPRFSQHFNGLIVVDKPVGPSSMQVVARVRYLSGRCKTGHAGTLDPLASGVLICCLGPATKSIPVLMDATKIYETEIDLTAFTNTDDAEGELEPVDVSHVPSLLQVQSVLNQHIGEIQQTPPAYSAIKINGVRAYKLARKDEAVEMPSRIVRIDAIDILDYTWPKLTIRITCGKGTYIRSLGRQIGTALGTGGYLSMLRRTAIGDYRIEQSIKMDHLPDPIQQQHLLEAPPKPVKQKKKPDVTINKTNVD